MSSSNYPHITDEMLSAYIDGVSTEDERNLIETVIASDDEVAWRVSSLRQTVAYLNDLPELVPPRSFALPVDTQFATEIAGLGESRLGESRLGRSTQAEPVRDTVGQAGWWSGLTGLFQGGGLQLSNAMIASAAIVLLLIGGGIFFGDLVRQNRSMLEGVAQTDSLSDGTDVQTGAQPALDSDENRPIDTMADESAADEPAADEPVANGSVVSETEGVTSSASASSGPILTPSATAMSIAVVPTATPKPSATLTTVSVAAAMPDTEAAAPVAAVSGEMLEESDADASDSTETLSSMASEETMVVNSTVMNSAAVNSTGAINPEVTPATPLIAPTPLAAKQSSVRSPAGPQGPAAPQAAPIAPDPADVQNDEADSALSAASIVQAETEAIEQEQIEAAIESATEIEGSTFVTIPNAPIPSASSSSSRRVVITDMAESGLDLSGASASSDDAGPQLLNSNIDLTVDVSTLKVEMNDETGALFGQLLVRSPDGEFRPLMRPSIRLTKIGADDADDMLEANPQIGEIDEQGVFMFLSVEPGTYTIQVESAGRLFTLMFPNDISKEFRIVIDAGTPFNVGTLRYEKLP